MPAGLNSLTGVPAGLYSLTGVPAGLFLLLMTCLAGQNGRSPDVVPRAGGEERKNKVSFVSLSAVLAKYLPL